MVVSVTLSFMLYAFIRVKGFQKRPINMVILFWLCWKEDFVCVYMCQSFCAFICLVWLF